MLKKVYKFGPEARNTVIKGAITACDIALNTIGPCGLNSLLGRSYQLAELTNDAKTTVADIYLDDEIEQLGSERVKEITLATFDKGGDSTTTTAGFLKGILITGQELLKENDFVKTTPNPIKVRNDIDLAAKEICEYIDKESKPVTTQEDMQKVAFASVENEEHAAIIASMFNIIGKDGSITIEDGYEDVIESEIVEGFEIEAGLSSETMANKDDKTYVMENPYVLITNISINFGDQVSDVTTQLYNLDTKVRDIIVISDSFSKEALQRFIEAKLGNMFNIVAIKAPYFNKKGEMEDIALALGAKFIDRELNTLFSNVQISDLGTTKKVIINKDKAVFLKPKGNVKERLTELNKELKANKSKYDKEQLKKRIAKLSGGVGVLRVGSVTQTNRDYLKKKLLNGVNSVKSSLKEGAIKGGGLTLIDISDKLPKNILSKAIRVPYEAIQKNAGGDLVIGDNVLDSAYNIKSALLVASKGAGDMLTIGFANADKYEKPKDFKDED